MCFCELLTFYEVTKNYIRNTYTKNLNIQK